MAGILKFRGVVFALLLAPCGAALAFTEDQPPKENSAAEQAKPRLICKASRDTGTRIGTKRICKSREEWRRESDAATQDLDAISRVGGDGPR